MELWDMLLNAKSADYVVSLACKYRTDANCQKL